MKNSLCLIKNCKEVVTSRGLCNKCYNIASGHVLDGDTSWEELEKMGLARKTIRRSTAFNEAYYAKVGKKKFIVN